MKSHDLGELLPRLTALGDAATEYVFLQNGIPWWWSHRDGEIAGAPLLARSVALVVQHAVERTAPGRIRVRRTGSDRYICARVQGEPDAPLLALVALWQAAGIPAESSADIRREVWTKLMSNATLNPLSAITGATVGELARTPRTRAVLLAGMAEIFRLAERDGHPLSMTPELRVRRADRHRRALRRAGAGAQNPARLPVDSPDLTPPPAHGGAGRRLNPLARPQSFHPTAAARPPAARSPRP
ncbi:ketopantoate reductase family protein [Azotobacter chroococcum]|uniref:ketopantoate reductase family protein n=1 Tax=Azotobacter chroococcum TaxID=353 RepID=UPI001E432361|nr:ketopantoate reductase C-terminal domain-containing protein [Azotobacter chroococcum]